MPAPANKPQQARSQARVARILDAAAAEILIAGVDGMTMNAVAKRAQTAAGSLYQFFPGKPALLGALADRYDAQLTEIAVTVAETLRQRPALNIEAAARAFLRPIVAFYTANPAYPVLADATHRPQPPKGIDGLTEARLARIVAESLAPHAAPTALPRLPVAARLMVEIGHSAIVLAIAAPGAARDALMDEADRLIAAYARSLT